MKFVAMILVLVLALVGSVSASVQGSSVQTQELTSREILYEYGVTDQYVFENVEGFIITFTQLIPSNDPENKEGNISLSLKDDKAIIFYSSIVTRKEIDSQGVQKFFFRGPDKTLISAVVITGSDGNQYVILGPNLESIIGFIRSH